MKHIPGRENVKQVVLDLSDTYNSFAKEFFPNSKLTADKFHVLRLLNPAINRYRKEITGDVRTNPIRKLLLRSGNILEYFEQKALQKWLDQYPALKEIYYYKEALHKLYRTRRTKTAKWALIKLTDQMALSNIKEIKTLRRTLVK